MARRRPISALVTDFAEVVALLKERNTIPAQSTDAMIATAKRIHANTYSLILWRFRLRKLPVHASVFIEEIASDALQILPQILMGYGKTALLLIRGVLENTLRHIYFFDHPIEFQRMNREAKWFLTADDLFAYAKNHPDFLKTEPKFDALAQLASLYSELSAGIHGRAVRDLEMRVALRKIVYDQGFATKQAEMLRKCTQASNFLLAVFHRNQVKSFQADDRLIILRTMPARARKIWTGHHD
jgi:hypothetical protein